MTSDKSQSSWRRGKVADFFTLQRGYDLTEKDAVPGSIPVYSSSGISYFHNRSIANGPGVITGRKGKLGRVFYVETEYWPHDTSLWVKDFKGNDPKFIKYFLDFLQLERFDAASSVPTLNRNTVHAINRNTVHAIKCFFPPRQEQCRIALILTSWETAIEKTEKLIEAKEKCFRWLMKKLISDQCKHWEHFQTEEIFESISEKNNWHEELLSVTQERGVVPRSMLEGRVMSPEGGTDTYKLIKKGDFAISLRSFQGGIEYSKYQGLISPAYTVLRPKLKIHDEFYRYFFKSHVFIEKYLNIAVIGIRDGKQISIPDFMTVKIPYPSFEQQRKSALVLNAARREIDLLKKQAEAYRKQKRGLMQKLLTGEWRVKAR